jgi:hypothetical protein
MHRGEIKGGRRRYEIGWCPIIVCQAGRDVRGNTSNKATKFNHSQVCGGNP